MPSRHTNTTLVLSLALLVPASVFAQAAEKPQEAKLIAVLKSDAPQKEKADACRVLAHVGTKEAVPVLAGLLADEQLSHMARYALEPIPDPSVDDALRDALGKLKGRPLIGVIGSLGVRRDGKAVEALAKFLQDQNPDMVRAAAQSLGSIGNSSAAQALEKRLSEAPAAQQLAISEGLFRCAEALLKKKNGAELSIAIYDRLRRSENAAQQVRTGSVRGAILARSKAGLPLLKEYLGNKDYILFAAACRASQEMPGADVTRALAEAMKGLPADNQVLLIQTLARRADKAAVPTLSAAAKDGDKPVRLAAIRALAEIGDASAVPALEELTKDADADLSGAAKESLTSLQARK